MAKDTDKEKGEPDRHSREEREAEKERGPEKRSTDKGDDPRERVRYDDGTKTWKDRKDNE